MQKVNCCPVDVAVKDKQSTPRISSLLADTRRPVSDSFATGFSYSRSVSAQDTSSVTKEPLRKAASDAKAVTDPVWKRGPLSKQASVDVYKPKPFGRQLSKGVSGVEKTFTCLSLRDRPRTVPPSTLQIDCEFEISIA